MSPTTGVVLTAAETSFAVDEAAIDLSIPLDFSGEQPSHFGAPRAAAHALAAGGFVGDTRSGGSCNCETLSLTPHCNGTHTECIGHVLDERISVGSRALSPLTLAALISVTPEAAAACGETAEPAPQEDDTLITARAIGRALDTLALGDLAPDALIVRTMPNDSGKLTRDYMQPPLPPYFSLEAVVLMVERDIRHLLCDLPSIDRIHDEGRLAGHRVFWGLAGVPDSERARATITEMIYAPDSVEDGLYALSLQLPSFQTDAAPSRPLLYALRQL